MTLTHKQSTALRKEVQGLNGVDKVCHFDGRTFEVYLTDDAIQSTVFDVMEDHGLEMKTVNMRKNMLRFYPA